ncbi:MAG: heme exporter protein CcmB [Pseudomonadota bacterium]|nr:heme exporter protein CcmB [Pseudomonadota bacterium]
MFGLILAQTVRLAFRKGGGALGTLAFYVIIVTLFTFALGPEEMKLHAGAVMCVGVLMSVLTALPLFYERDFEDGTLEQFLLQPVLLEMLVLGKIAGQWLASMLPLLVLSPLLAVMAGLNGDDMLAAMARLLLASPTIIALGSIAAALTLGHRRGGLLQALIVLPLYIPVLIFASATTGPAGLWLLGAMFMASLPLSCLIGAALIRMSQD